MKQIKGNYPKNFTLVFFENGSKERIAVKRIRTKSKNKFTRIIRQIPDQFDVLLKVSYVDGGWNDGYYSKKDDLMLAYLAFTEK